MAFCVTLFWIAVSIQCTVVISLRCHKLCNCELLASNEHAVACHSKLAVQQTNVNSVNASLHPSCSEVLQIEKLTFSFPINHLSISCVEIVSPEKLVKFTNLITLTVTNTNMTAFSMDFVRLSVNLNKLNLSSNQLQVYEAPKEVVFRNLEDLDLANNALTQLDIQSLAIPQIKQIAVQNNKLSSTVSLQQLKSLLSMDISSNSFKNEFNLTKLSNIQSLVAKNVDAIYAFNSDGFCKNCNLLPNNLVSIYLQNNRLFQVPTCSGLLAGLHNLSILQLDCNRISVLTERTLNGQCFATLQFLHLSHNRLVKVNGASLNYLTNLHFLDVSYNYLQHLEPNILQRFTQLAVNGYSIGNNDSSDVIVLHNNTWSCDCLSISLQSWILHNSMATQVFACHHPKLLQAHFLEDVTSSDLTCRNASIAETHNVTAVEFESATLVCSASGVPRPLVHWVSPKGETISLESIATDSNQQDSFSLSEFGETLSVQNVRLRNTGIYTCVAFNNISTTEATVALSVLLGQTSTIILLSVACVAFMIAVVVNSINMCVYICEHVEKKRQYKKALQAQKEEEKQNPPIKLRSRSFDESMASLSANRHYSRYDFTCQQMFLDTVVKGAHSVKKTLYDARHSEFSANMWGYAANIRERLHIEMPSGVQLPSISMPSISMPSISMPTMPNMPTMQDINTNIERLGSSVVQRSHTLASSVGSVFTLKRWMWQTQNNSSDNESRDSDENLAENPSITQVCVDVHSQQQPPEDSGLSQPPFQTEEPSTSRKDSFFQLGRMYNLGLVRSKSLIQNMPHGSKSREDCGQSSAETATSAIVNVHPNITTISSTVDTTHWHSYETSV